MDRKQKVVLALLGEADIPLLAELRTRSDVDIVAVVDPTGTSVGAALAEIMGLPVVTSIAAVAAGNGTVFVLPAGASAELNDLAAAAQVRRLRGRARRRTPRPACARHPRRGAPPSTRSRPHRRRTAMRGGAGRPGAPGRERHPRHPPAGPARPRHRGRECPPRLPHARRRDTDHAARRRRPRARRGDAQADPRESGRGDRRAGRADPPRRVAARRQRRRRATATGRRSKPPPVSRSCTKAPCSASSTSPPAATSRPSTTAT